MIVYGPSNIYLRRARDFTYFSGIRKQKHDTNRQQLLLPRKTPLIIHFSCFLCSSSGFKESKQLVKYIDLIQLNMKTAEKQGHRAQITQLATELRRVIQRIQEVQTRMQRLTLKVNLPRNEELFNQGHGEGCFVVVEEETKAHFDVNNAGGVFLGILLNSPVYKEWFHLEEGDPVLFCMKGQLRPVAFVDQTAMVDHLRALFAAERQQLEEKLESKNSPNIMEAVARDAEILRQQQPQIPSEVISGKE